MNEFTSIRNLELDKVKVFVGMFMFMYNITKKIERKRGKRNCQELVLSLYRKKSTLNIIRKIKGVGVSVRDA